MERYDTKSLKSAETKPNQQSHVSARKMGCVIATALLFTGLAVAVFLISDQIAKKTTLGIPQFQDNHIELIDQNGIKRKEDDFADRPIALFFGFTYCPDVCPTTMAFLDNFVAGLDEDERLDTQVVMVSVDPARDTVEQLAQYVPFFNPTFIGVTGELLDIHRFATALNTPFRKVAGSGDDYQVDHSANVVLINPKGDYHGFFKAPLDREKMMKTYRAARSGWKH